MDEFCALTDDVIVKMNETNWLRVPVGTLHTDRSRDVEPHGSPAAAVSAVQGR